MKTRHKINHGWIRPSDPIDERYQRQVDRSTTRAEAAYRKAQESLRRAQERLARTQAKPVRTRADKDRLRDLQRAVDERREELARLHALMAADPYGSGDRQSVSIVNKGKSL